MLFTAWTGDPFRPTRDVDLLGFGESDPATIGRVFQEICGQAVDDDALRLDGGSLQAERIRDAQEYAGVRVRLIVFLGGARIPVQIDIGFGDAITPAAVDLDFPPLLDAAAPRLLAYPKETVVAEKFEAIVNLGEANSRMKDYYDLVALSRLFAFEGATLGRAIAATFRRRETAIPAERPVGLSPAFGTDRQKTAQWTAFTRREPLLVAAGGLPEVMVEIAAFIMPPALAARTDGEFAEVWAPGGPWRAAQ